jgi:predicted RNase H-like HicB family nuclease
MKRYAIVVERAKSNYSAYVPDLPGCVATGATVEETEGRLRVAIEVHVQGMREDGLCVPEPSSIVDYVDVPA